MLNNANGFGDVQMVNYSIEIITEGLMPLTPRTKLRIDESGKAVHHQQKTQDVDAKITESKFSLDSNQMNKITEIIDSSSFFELESPDSESIDGDQVQLTVATENKTHSVLLINNPLPEFDDLIKKINAIIPEKYRVSYNSLILEQHDSGDI